MSLNPPQSYRKTRYIHRRGLHANRPNATDVLAGTLYFSTDLFIVTRSNGTIWESYSGQVSSSNNISYPIPLDGEDGFDGFIGASGARGPAGANGISSPPIPGIDGIDGDDTFNIPPTNQLITPASITFTTTGNIDDLDFSNSPLIRMNNATDATIRGLKAGFDGQRVTIISIGAGNVLLSDQDTNSSANNRFINTATSAKTPLATGKGKAIYQYDGITLRWRLISHDQGTFIQQPFSATDFTGNGAMLWIVDSFDVESYAYYLFGKILHCTWFFGDTSVGGTPNQQLQAKIPGGFTCAISGSVLSFLKDNGTITTGRSSVSTGITNINITRLDQTNFSASTDRTQWGGSMFFEVQ